MRRLFGVLTFICAAAWLGYMIESNPVGAIVFGIFAIVFGFVWIGSPPPGAKPNR